MPDRSFRVSDRRPCGARRESRFPLSISEKQSRTFVRAETLKASSGWEQGQSRQGRRRQGGAASSAGLAKRVDLSTLTG